ncbi:MAG: M50 family metallopeptidase [Acholeplasmatales bacterium]
MKYLKKYKILIFLIMCFILGFLTMPLFHNGYIGTLLNTFTYVNGGYQVLIIIGLLFLVVLLHELAHFLTFIFMGVKSEAIIVFMFLFYKNKDNKWRLKINPKLLLLGGGLVWPSLGPINNEEDFKKARKAMQTSLLAAPLFTLISGVLFLLVSMIFFYDTFSFPISFYIFLFTIIYTYASTMESSQIVGDFKAYKRVKNDLDFSNLVILQYCDLTDYQYEYIENYLKEHNFYNRQTRTYLGYLLEKHIFGNEEVSMFFI